MSCQAGAATSYVADLGLGTRVTGTVRTSDCALSLIGIELADDTVVALHRGGELVPESGVQRRTGGPVGRLTVGLTRTVLELERRARGVEAGK